MLMVNAEGQNAVRADEDTLENMPLMQEYPFRSGEYLLIGLSSNIPFQRSAQGSHVFFLYDDGSVDIGPNAPQRHARRN
eukprot:8747525-Pyramimonas_sp.AAC.1